MTKAARQHSWIYAALIEMNEYCRGEGLDEVAARLCDAIAEIEPVIFAPVFEDLNTAAPARPNAEVLPFALPS